MMNLFRKFKERFWVDPDNEGEILLKMEGNDIYRYIQ